MESNPTQSVGEPVMNVGKEVEVETKPEMTATGDYETPSFLSRMPKFKTSALVGVDDEMTRTYGSIEDSAIHVLKKQFEEQTEFCDATMMIRGQELKAHWCILVACPYFEALYRSSLTGVRPERVTLDIASKEIMFKVIKYLYMGRIDISRKIVIDLIIIADYLQIDELKKKCFIYIEHSRLLNNDNCVKLLWLSKTYGDDAMYKNSVKHLCLNLDLFIKSAGDILDVPGEFIMSIVTDERFFFIPCMKMFDLIINWTEHDIIERLSVLSHLIASLEFIVNRQNDHEFFKTIQDHKLVRESQDVIDFIAEIEQPKEGAKETCLLVESMTSKQKICAYVISENRFVHLPKLETFACHWNGYIACNRSKVYSLKRKSTLHLHDFLSDETSTRMVPPLLSDGMFVSALGDNDEVLAVSANDGHLFKYDKLGFQFTEVPQSGIFGLVRLIRQVVVDDRYVCVMGMFGNAFKAQFYYYDLTTNKVSKSTLPCLDVKPNNDTIYMYTTNSIVVVGIKDKSDAYVYDFNARRKYWRENKQFALPTCPYGAIITDTTGTMYTSWPLASYNNCLYTFINSYELSSANKPNRSHTVSIVKYDLIQRQWSLLDHSIGPARVSGKGSSLVEIPRKMLWCHFECPHCEAKTVYSNDDWAVEPSDDEMDDYSNGSWDVDMSGNSSSNDDFLF